MRGVFQATIVDETGDIIPECNIEVRDEETGELAQAYDAFEDGEMLGAPFTADVNGFTRFYVESGLYRVRAYLGEFERERRHVLMGAGPLAAEGQEPIETEIEASSYTGALTGLTSSVNTTVQVRKAGDMVCISWSSATGTSNSNALSVTGMPVAFRPGTT